MILDILAFVTCVRVFNPYTRSIVSTAVSDHYEVSAVAQTADVTTTESVFIVYRNRHMYWPFEWTAAYAPGRFGSVRMVSPSVVYASTSWNERDSFNQHFFVNLDCDFDPCTLRRPEDQKVRDTLYQSSAGTQTITLVQLDSDQKLFRVTLKSEGYWVDRLYIIGARDVRVLEAEERSARLNVWWECRESPEEYEYSHYRGIVASPVGQVACSRGESP